MSNKELGSPVRTTVWGRAARGSLAASALLLLACGGGGGDSAGGSSGTGGAAKPLQAAGPPQITGRETALARMLDFERDRPDAPIDRGEGVEGGALFEKSAQPPEASELGDDRLRAPASKPRSPDGSGGPEAGTKGSWTPAMGWPIIAIHAVLAPNGKVLTYGTDQSGAQGAQLFYDVWDPVTQAHSLLPNTTGTDIFCSAQLVLPDSGQVLLAGGDIRGQRVPDGAGGIIVNRGVRDVNLFNADTLTLAAAGQPMNYARWYATLTTLSDGRVLALGGTDASGAGVRTPEVFNGIGAGWLPLSGVSFSGDILYPRSFLAPNGKVVVASDTRVFSLDPTGAGALTQIGTLPHEIAWDMPIAMIGRGKALLMSRDGTTSVLDINGAEPSVAVSSSNAGSNRSWATMTVLPDGQVLNTGGSYPSNSGQNLALDAAIWNPSTGQWTSGASAAKGREYHSTALLLPDATVLVAGGGAPGVVRQLNAEIYAPPYLFNKDAAGQRAARPMLMNAPKEIALGSTPFGLHVMSKRPIRRVTLVRTGSVTHSLNFDQRFLELPFTQSGNKLQVTADESSAVLPPGHYMLFAIDDAGVPSIAQIVKVGVRPA